MSQRKGDSRRRTNNSSNNLDARMRMDSYKSSRASQSRTRPARPRHRSRSRHSRSPPARRREMDSVMKSARRGGANQSSYWNKKLLEAEEKDPNRWRHSGYKEMYRHELGSGSAGDSNNGRSRSGSRSKTNPRSPLPQRGKQQKGGHSSPPPQPAARTRSPRPGRPRSPPSPPSRKGDSKGRTSRGRPRTPVRRKASPSPRSRRSRSYSSSQTVSSCSDDSCSVCSPKHGHHSGASPTSPPTSNANNVRHRSPTPPPVKRPAIENHSPPKKKTKTAPPVKKTVKKKEAEPKKSVEKSKPVENRKKANSPAKETPRKKGKVSSETRQRPKSPLPPRTPESTSGSVSSSSTSEGETSSDEDENSGQPRVSLSERFGKMAQWSVDRKEYDTIKMKITKDASSSGMKVVIENDPDFPAVVAEHSIVQVLSPKDDYAYHYEKRRFFFERTYTEDRPIGPDVPLNWQDPLARYSYYRDMGLLWDSDVKLDDYIKWEQWWYKYQEWLDVERAFYGDSLAIANARRERERDWACYRSSNLGRSSFDRELLPMPRSKPWTNTRPRRGRRKGART